MSEPEPTMVLIVPAAMPAAMMTSASRGSIKRGLQRRRRRIVGRWRYTRPDAAAAEGRHDENETGHAQPDGRARTVRPGCVPGSRGAATRRRWGSQRTLARA